MKNLAIIPARGGSKRIPKKNIKEFSGKPIISYSIENALKSDLFDEVMVSTDDSLIAEISIKYGAEVPFFRSEKNSNDFATTMDVILEVLDLYYQRNILFENVCCIYPTAPLMTAEDLCSGYKILIGNSNFDTVFPVTGFSYPIMRSLEIDENGFLKMKWPEYLNVRSQDIKPAYHDAGQWYWYKYSSLKSGKIINAKPFLINSLRTQDIDNLEDWKIAELKYQLLKS